MKFARLCYNIVTKCFFTIQRKLAIFSTVFFLIITINLLNADSQVEYYTRSILIDSKDSDSFFSRGYAYYVKKDYDNAIYDFNMAIRYAPKEILPYFFRGKAYFAKRNYLNAINDFSKVVSINPRHLKSYYYMAQSKIKLKAFDSALSLLDQAIKLKPDMAESYALRAKVKNIQNNIQGAISDFEKANEIDSSNPKILNNFAWFLINLKDKKLKYQKKAVNLAETAVRLDKQDVYLDTLACAYSEIKDFKKAYSTAIEAYKLNNLKKYRKLIAAFKENKTYSQILKEENEENEKILEQKYRKKINLQNIWQNIVRSNENQYKK